MLAIEEMDIFGFTKVNLQLTKNEIEWFKNDIQQRKNAEISKYGKEKLAKTGTLDVVRNLFRFCPEYIKLLESKTLNNLTNKLLSKTAILHDVFAMLNTTSDNMNLTRNKFHRDQPCLKNIRSSILFLIFLVDSTPTNGTTQVVPATHVMKKQPSNKFLEKHKINLTARAGDAFLMDGALIHKAGINSTNEARPLIIIRYQLAFMKQSTNLCNVYKSELEATTNELIRQRMGWYCRGMDSASEWNDENNPKWGRGLYEMKGAWINE